MHSGGQPALDNPNNSAQRPAPSELIERRILALLATLDLLVPLGGVGGNLGALLTGIAIARAGRWRGWQRYAVLLYGLYYLLVLFLPIVIADAGPTLLTETGWALAWLGIGAALFTFGRAQVQTPTARASAGAS